MIPREETLKDREGLLLIVALISIVLISGGLLPSAIQPLTSLLAGATILGAGSAWSYAVLRGRDGNLPAIIGAGTGIVATLLVLLADLLLG